MTHLPRHAPAAVAIALTAAAAAPAQQAASPLAPVRTYNGINRPIPIRVDAPAVQGAEAAAATGPESAPGGAIAQEPAEPELRIELIRPDGEVVADAETEAGLADLAQLFPALWTRPADEADLLYAQLVAGDERRGPALVLEPMLTPTYPAGATTDAEGRIRPRASIDRTGRPSFLELDSGEIVYSGLRIWTDCQVVLETSAGPIELIMRPDEAPNTVWHFMCLVEGGLYTDVSFHRIVPDNSGHPFVIQTGDPSGTGAGGAGFYADLEQSGLPHGYGVVSMARAADPNTNGSQFFIALSREATRHLDGAYTSFAQVAKGGEAIARIAAAPIDEAARPIGEPPRVLSARTKAAPPRGAGPEPLPRPGAEGAER